MNLLEDPEFAEFRGVLNGQMKKQNATGEYVERKQSTHITPEMEDILWEKGLLGDHCPQALLDTLVYLNGFCFALRSGDEHRRLRYTPCQIKVVNTVGRTTRIMYCEDISKTNQGGLKSRKVTPKRVVHHANEENPARCLVRLFQKYNSLCPSVHPDHALYLTPLKNPTSGCWFSRVPVGHNALSDTIPRLMREAKIDGYFTNHSLRSTCTTRLYDAQLDEASIMQRTGHRSVNGYKRESEKLCELTSSILNRNQKKVKLEDVKAAGSENVHVRSASGELALVKQNGSGMQSLPTMPWSFTIHY